MSTKRSLPQRPQRRLKALRSAACLCDSQPTPPHPQVFESLLTDVAAGAVLTLERIASVLPYPLDPFQADAVRRHLEGASVVVCAPTGAGKTAIAVAAAVPVLARGQRVIYTTPLKALSNQKFRELVVRVGDCGLGVEGWRLRSG